MEQTVFPFYLDTDALKAFLIQYAAIEAEEDRLREEKRLLVEEHKENFPMRAIRTAIKVVRARRKLADHEKEPMPLAHQDELERLVEQHLFALEAETRAVPDMVGAQGL